MATAYGAIASGGTLALAGGTPDVSDTQDLTMRIGAGPVITLASQGSGGGALAQPGMARFLDMCAEVAGVTPQRGLFYGGNSDAASMHLVGSGVPAAGMHRIEVTAEDGSVSEAELELRYACIHVLSPIGKQKRYPALDLTILHAKQTACEWARNGVAARG